ncbi:MAG: Ig-like domain-containing protein [Clostridia bacterium]|nr:Ig-like domain-containing protein [Clostridia bacterium]
MKKTWCTILCAACIAAGNIIPAAAVSNTSLIESEFDIFPEDWQTFTASNSNSVMEVNDGELSVNFDTTGKAAKAKSEVRTAEFKASSDYLALDLKMRFYGDNEKISRTVSLVDDNGFVVYELMEIKADGVFSFFGKETPIEAADNYEVSFVLAMNENKAYAEVNGKQVYLDTVSDFAVLNKEKLSIDLKNSLSTRVSADSQWYFDYLRCTEANEVIMYSDADEQNVFKVSEINEFKIYFDGYPSTDSREKDNYKILKDGAEIDFNIRYDNKVLAFIPVEGFEEGCQYKIEISDIKDVFNNQASKIIEPAFSVVSDEYDPDSCKIEISLINDNEIYEGMETQIHVSAAVDEQLEYVMIYADNEKAAEILENEFDYSLYLNPGQHEIYAVMYLKSGIKVKSNVIDVNVAENSAPDIIFEGIDNNAVFDLNNECIIKAAANDSDGIEKLELYKNGSLIASTSGPELVYDVSELGIGRFTITLKAFDLYNKMGEKSADISVIKSFKNLLFEDNEFVSDKPGYFKSGMNYSEQRGFCKPGSVDAEHGTSLLMGVNEHNGEFTDGQYSYCQYPLQGYSNFVLSYDVNVIERPKDGAKNCVNMGVRFTGGTTVVFMNLQSNFNVNGKKFQYDTEKWYHIDFELNSTENKMRIYINNELFAEETFDTGEYISKYGTPQQFRFYSPVLNDTPCSIALDNFELNGFEYAPYITDIEDDVQKSPVKVSYDTKNIILYLSGSIYEGDIDYNHINLIDENGRNVSITPVYNSTENTITLKLNDNLSKNTKYTAVINSDTRISESEIIGINVLYEFVTNSGALSVEDVEFTVDSGIVHADVSLVNNDYDTGHCYILAGIYENNDFCSMKALECSIAGNSRAIKEIEFDNMMNKRIELYVVDSLSKPHLISNQIYSY